MRISEQSLRKIVRGMIKESSGSTTPVVYSSRDDLIEKLKPLVSAAWARTRAEVVRRYPEHAVVLKRTRFVPVYPGTKIPGGVLDHSEKQVGEFVSRCNDLFAKSRVGTRCRAEGNLANPPTHNAVYVDIVKMLHLDDLASSGTFNFYDGSLVEVISHEFAHAIDILSSVTGEDQIRDVASEVIDDMFDLEAIKDKQAFLDKVEDRMIRSRANDHDIDTALEVAEGGWEHAQEWFSRKNERTALAIQLASALDRMGMSGNDFISSNIYALRVEIPSHILDISLAYVLYGILSDDIDDEIERIQELTL